jgi:hypothetical protein
MTLKKTYYTIKVECSIDEVVGKLFSMSFGSKKILGQKAKPFEREPKKI